MNCKLYCKFSVAISLLLAAGCVAPPIYNDAFWKRGSSKFRAGHDIQTERFIDKLESSKKGCFVHVFPKSTIKLLENWKPYMINLRSINRYSDRVVIVRYKSSTKAKSRFEEIEKSYRTNGISEIRWAERVNPKEFIPNFYALCGEGPILGFDSNGSVRPITELKSIFIEDVKAMSDLASRTLITLIYGK